MAEVIARHTHHAPGDLDASTKLFADGLGLDSIELLEILLEMEVLAGVRLRESDIDSRAFATIGSLASYVSRLRS